VSCPFVVLVGTVHRDPEGLEQLLSVLREENPDLLTLEMSPYAVQFRRERRLALGRRVSQILAELAQDGAVPALRSLRSHPAIRDVFLTIDFPYEYKAASIFSRRRTAPFYCIDRSDVSRKKIAWIERELITKENLRMLARSHPSETRCRIESEYLRAFLAIERGRMPPGGTQDRRERSMRDRFMAGKIRGILEASRCCKLLHIGGWEHLVDNGEEETLFKLLSDLLPQRRLLGGPPRIH
jgi:hypothetical protein